MLYIYILKCEQNKYYVGKTTEPHNRLKSHYCGNGSAWTKKFKPICTLEVIPNCNAFDEDKYTKMYMDKYGIENVRGGTYCQIHLDEILIAFIKKELNAANDKCYKCGSKGHFGRFCSYGSNHTNDVKNTNINTNTNKKIYTTNSKNIGNNMKKKYKSSSNIINNNKYNNKYNYNKYNYNKYNYNKNKTLLCSFCNMNLNIGQNYCYNCCNKI